MDEIKLIEEFSAGLEFKTSDTMPNSERGSCSMLSSGRTQDSCGLRMLR